MFSLSDLGIRSFEADLGSGVIKLFPPKLKVLRKIQEAASKGNDIDAVTEAVVLILNTNGKMKFTAEKVEEIFEIDSAKAFIKEYFAWYKGIAENPN